MSNTTTTGAMNLPIPNLNDYGPDYATNTNQSLAYVSDHDHDGSEHGGAPINLSGQTVSGDLSLFDQNLSNVRSIQFTPQPGTLNGTQDVNSLYVNGTQLGFNNQNGIFVPITNGNTLAITSLPFTNFQSRAITSNATILPTDTYNLLNVDSTGGAIQINLPIAALISPNAQNRLFIFRDIGLHAALHPITISVAPGSGNTFADGAQTKFVINNNGGYVGIYTDGSGLWYSWTQNIFNFETLQVNNSQAVFNATQMTMIGNSSLISSGFGGSTGSIEIIGSNAFWNQANLTFNSGEVFYNGACEVFWSGTATEIFNTGTSTTYLPGSELFLGGTLAGTTSGGALAMNNTLNLLSTTTLTGPTVFNGNSLTIHNGPVAITGSTPITMSAQTQLVNNGTTTLNGTVFNYVSVSGSTSYTCDSGSTQDYYILLNLTSTSTITILLPPAPVVGRTICLILEEFAGTTQTITINGNGSQVRNPNTGASAATLVFNGSYSPPRINLVVGSLPFVFNGTQWIPLSSTV